MLWLRYIYAHQHAHKLSWTCHRYTAFEMDGGDQSVWRCANDRDRARILRSRQNKKTTTNYDCIISFSILRSRRLAASLNIRVSYLYIVAESLLDRFLFVPAPVDRLSSKHINWKLIMCDVEQANRPIDNRDNISWRISLIFVWHFPILPIFFRWNWKHFSGQIYCNDVDGMKEQWNSLFVCLNAVNHDYDVAFEILRLGFDWRGPFAEKTF